ncbi:MAG: metallophosphoesterase [Anaerovibrio sp.]|nr:metallophosphoesterase [Anaerovibrio sp.]
MGMVVGYSIGHGNLFSGILLHFACISFMGQLVFDLLVMVRLLFAWGQKKMLSIPEDKSRRSFLRGSILLPASAAAVALYGGLIEKNNTVVRKFDIPVAGIPDDIRGFSIAQLSDIHLGPFMSLDDLENLMEKTAALGCDILVITGDLFDDKRINFKAASLIDTYVDRFKYGIVYCRGNHEHLRGIQAIDMAIARTRIRYLVNSVEYIVGSSLPIYMAGVDYPIKRDEFDFLRDKYADTALKGIPEKSVKVLLAHHPDFIDPAEKYGVQLVLSGHTHGGQLGLFGIPLVPPVFKYLRGIYHVGKTVGYVHSGNGSWFPFRFGCPPEIAIFTLTDNK